MSIEARIKRLEKLVRELQEEKPPHKPYTVERRGNLFTIATAAQRFLGKNYDVEYTHSAAQKTADRLNKQRERVSERIERKYQKAMKAGKK